MIKKKFNQIRCLTKDGKEETIATSRLLKKNSIERILFDRGVRNFDELIIENYEFVYEMNEKDFIENAKLVDEYQVDENGNKIQNKTKVTEVK